MIKKHTYFLTMATGVALILSGCSQKNVEPTAIETTDSTETNSTSAMDSASNVSTTSDEERAAFSSDSASVVSESSIDTSAKEEEDNLKEEYLIKVEEAEKETEKKRQISPDSSTYALKNVEGDLFDLWDGLLNDIYGVLNDQLPSDKMDIVRKEQREWLAHRDEEAKEASLEYEGGTMEQLEYTTVLNNLNAERCRELVEMYML